MARSTDPLGNVAPRRTFLRALAGVATAGAAATFLAVARRGAAVMRPSARGRSAATCAACGSTAHAMLDPSCPAAPEVM